jgi:ribosomal-protein-alanine N-acetyltransferase
MNIIETDRFIIREWMKEDATRLVTSRSHYSISKCLGEPNTFPYDIARATEHILFSQKENNFNFAITIDNIIVGEIGFALKNEKIGSISCWISPEYQRKGIATDAVKSFTEYAFKKYPIWFMEASILKDHIAPSRVIERAGYIQKEVDEDSDVNIYFRVNTNYIWNKSSEQLSRSHVRRKNVSQKK